MPNHSQHTVESSNAADGVVPRGQHHAAVHHDADIPANGQHKHVVTEKDHAKRCHRDLSYDADVRLVKAADSSPADEPNGLFAPECQELDDGEEVSTGWPDAPQRASGHA
jgi:hypothetical protein